MRIPPSTYVLGLLTAITLAGAPAHAASTSASIFDIKYELIDLDLTDNILPTMTINHTSIVSTAFFYTDAASNGYKPIYDYGSSFVEGAHGSAFALSSPSQIWGWASYISPTGQQQAYGDNQVSLQFSLSPNTGLLFSALGVLSSDPVTSDSEASLSVSGYTESVQDGVHGRQGFSHYYQMTDGQGDYRLQGYLASGGKAEQGYFEFSTDAHVHAAPVPEPATYGMLLTGALVIGAAASRRTRRLTGERR